LHAAAIYGDGSHLTGVGTNPGVALALTNNGAYVGDNGQAGFVSNRFKFNASDLIAYGPNLQNATFGPTGMRVENEDYATELIPEHVFSDGWLYGRGGVVLSMGPNGSVLEVPNDVIGANLFSDGEKIWAVRYSAGLGSRTNFVLLDDAAVGGVVAPTNGVVLWQLPEFPTNSVPWSTAAVTNWLHCVLTNYGPVDVATNPGAANWIIMKPNGEMVVY
jgi:hypothetical protein